MSAVRARRYQDLGLQPVVNAAATLTRLGGSLMPPTVLEAMADAAQGFVDLPELQRKVGERLAELTRNEAAYVSSGAAAGITLTVAACIAGTDPERIAAFPDVAALPRSEVIIHRVQRNGYDYAARQTGARIVEIEGTRAALEEAITERTACVLFFAGAHYATDALPLPEVVEIAHGRRVPVIVDAAAQIPPVSSLWHFTAELGVDAAIVSGGKGLRGPQSSGLVLGRSEIIEGCRANGNPNHSIGRPMKVGKEEMLGLLAAVEWMLEQDEPRVLAGYEATVETWIRGLAGIPGVRAERGFPSEAGQPHGRAIVHIAPPCRLGRDEVVQALWTNEPRIAVSTNGTDAVALNPQTLEAGQDEVVLQALRRILTT
ncbi:MAG: aminotransferase class V-fold PLP-dependent enzyme [Candidatus Dormibacteraceae bacterium]